MSTPRVIALVLVGSALAGLTLAYAVRQPVDETAGRGANADLAQRAISATGTTPVDPFGRDLELKPGSQRILGEFPLPGGRMLRLFSAETKNGRSCLVDENSGVGQSAGCHEGGLFARRRAEFSVSTQGGPERFDELYLAGVAAPGVRGVVVVKTDGSFAPLELVGERAFLFQSSSSELVAGVYPTGLRLYAAGGKLLESITFPPAG